jgi:hypothetical protein
MTKWSSILPPSSESARRAWESINAIADDILEQRYVHASIPLRTHSVYEDAILLAYVARARNDRKWETYCLERLNWAIEHSVPTMSHFALFRGLCGLGWTVEHLSHVLSGASEQTQWNDLDCVGDETQKGDPCEDLDETLIRSLQSGQLVEGYDLVSGLVGGGVYFLERWPGGQSIDGLGLVVDGLERLAEKIGPDLAWYSPPESLSAWQRKKSPTGRYDLGIAHGAPGVLHFLCQVARVGIETPRVSSLLKQAMNWFLAQASPNKEQSRFGAWVSPTGVSAMDPRPTWCYGDLGIAAILLQIADQTLDDRLGIFARDVLDRCINLPPNMYQIHDAGLCHGATGVAHIYNRLYQTTGDYRYRDASVFWFECALSMFTPGTGVGGYSRYVTPDNSSTVTWESSPAFLDGSIGVALALLGSVTAVEPQWDRALLLSSRPLQVRSGEDASSALKVQLRGGQ